jgi:transposase-like protein
MTKRTRRTHSPAFKAKVALAAIKGGKRSRASGVQVAEQDDHRDHDSYGRHERSSE